MTRSAILALASLCTVLGCSPTPDRGRAGVPSAELQVHAVMLGHPSAEGLAYLKTVADVHDAVRAAPDRAGRIALLREALALVPPAGLGEAEVARLELQAALAAALLEDPAAAGEAVALLSPELALERSLPLDRVSARALIVLGDAARRTGDDALAAGSYARAIRVMSMLRQELEP